MAPEAEEAEEPEVLVPEEDVAEPEADPVLYDLWVCGVQVTSANKGSIVPGVSFNATTNTLSFNGNAVSTLANSEYTDVLTNGAVIYSELPELIINSTAAVKIQSDTAEKLIYVNGGNLTLKAGTSSIQTLSSESAYYGILVEGGNLTIDNYMQITAPAAEYGIFVADGNLLLDKITINYSTGPKDMVPVVLLDGVQNGVGITNGTVSGTTGLSSSTITINGVRTGFSAPTLQGDTVQNAMVTSDDANLTFGGKLWIYSKNAQFGVYVPNGTVTNTGDLNADLRGATADSSIYAENGFTSNGKLKVNSYDCDGGYGIKVMNGPVTINGEVTYISAEHTGIYCGNGDVTITGVTSFSINHNEEGELSVSSGVYAANGSVTMGAFDIFGGANWVVYANGPIHITDAIDFVNEGDMLGGNGIKSTQGGIVIDGNTTIEAINCIVSEGEEGILINGDATLTSKGRYAMSATNGPITVNGNLKATGAGYTAVTAKGDITVEGNAYASASTPAQFPEFPGNAMESTDGSINVTGNLSCYSTKNPCYAKNDIRVGGDALFSFALSASAATADFGARAENGEIVVSGNLTCKGKAVNSLYAGTSITVEQNATITNEAEDSVGMNAVGFINFVSGKWDVTATTAALRAGNGIVIADGYGVTLPEGGKVAQVDDLFTVTEADGTTVAAHAIIEEKAETTVTLSFDAGEGTVDPATKEVTPGEAVGELPVPTREDGWVFIGWFTEPAASYLAAGQGTQVTAETTVDADTTFYAHWRLPGDINGDGKVNNKDVTRLQKYLKGDDVEVVTFNLDTNGDGSVNNKDLTRLQRFVKGLDVELH